MSAVDRPATPPPSRSSANCASASTPSISICRTCAAISSSNRSGSSARTVSTTSNANAMCIDSSRKTQLVPGRQPVEEAARAQEVDVGERAVEEQPLDDRGEADQVEQELPPVLAGLELVEVEDRVDPPEAEVGLGLDRGDVVDRRERLVPLASRRGRRCRAGSGRTARAPPPRRAGGTGRAGPRGELMCW